MDTSRKMNTDSSRKASTVNRDSEIVETHVGTTHAHEGHVSGREEWKVASQKLIDDLSDLVEKQKRLFSTEIGEKSDDIKTGVESIGLGVAVMSMFMFALTSLIIIGLNYFMPLWASAAIVTVVLGIAGFAILKSGTNKLSLNNLTPNKSIDTINLMIKRLKESYYALRHS